MSLDRFWYTLVWTLQALQVVQCCVNDGDFDCSRRWYFWFGLFWAFIILLVTAKIIYIKRCQDNRVACVSRGHRRSRRSQKKRHPESVNSGTLSSSTSQATTVTIIPASQAIVPVSKPHQQQHLQQQQQQQFYVGVRPDSRMNQSTGLLSTTTGEKHGQSPFSPSPVPNS